MSEERLDRIENQLEQVIQGINAIDIRLGEIEETLLTVMTECVASWRNYQINLERDLALNEQKTEDNARKSRRLNQRLIDDIRTMDYHNFTLKTVKDQFKLNILNTPFCKLLLAADPQPAFLTIFEQWFRLAETVQSAKAKSELLVSPILAEVVQLTQKRVQLFSGEKFNVDLDRGLDGVVDFLLSKSTTPYLIEAPIVMLVEADKEGLDLGWGQCVAQMIAAQKFNTRKGNEISVIYGSVTNGKLWQFLKLEGKDVTIDCHEYYVTPVERILGILKWMVDEQA